MAQLNNYGDEMIRVNTQKNIEEEVWSTEVTKEDLANSVKDEFGVKYSGDGKRLLKVSNLKGKYVIREGVRVIGDGAFSNCDSLKSITIPNGVTSIGDCAFYNCRSLESLTISNGVTSIGDSAFSSCSSLESLTIPDGVTSIGDRAFDGCRSLESIILPQSVVSIKGTTFNNCI